MSRRFRRFKRSVTALGAATLLQLGPCLPDNYFADTAQSALVSLADTVVEVALAQVAVALGLPVDGIASGDDNGSGTTN